VDPVSRRDFWRILYQLLRERVTVFVSTAYLDEAERCSRLGLLHEGRLLACDTPDAVKGLMHGTLLEFRPDSPRRAAALLRERLPGHAVSLFGDRVHLVTETPEASARDVRAWLAAAGLESGEVLPVAPSLEDVFVSVLGRPSEQREGGHAAG
jgi:ABC-2 type transport system ATP-binding protein